MRPLLNVLLEHPRKIRFSIEQSGVNGERGSITGTPAAPPTGELRFGREEDAIMTVSVNGTARTVLEGTTLGELITQLGLRREGIAVARNDDVVSRSAVDITALHDGDTIEIIAAVAGG